MPLADLLHDGWEPEVRAVDMLLDRTAGSRLQRATRSVELAKARLNKAEEAESGSMSRPEVARAKGELEEAEAELVAAQTHAQGKRVTVYLRELGNRRWKELLWLVPPTAQQRERLGQQLDHNPELFPIVAIAFSLVDVEQREDGSLKVVGPAVDREQLDALDAALAKAAGDPKRAERACDHAMPEDIVTLNERLRAGGWERLAAVLFELNLEVSQVPLSLTGSGRIAAS
jgi:hypothetical protein